MFVGQDNVDGSKECSQAKRGLWSFEFIDVRSRGPPSVCSILDLLVSLSSFRSWKGDNESPSSRGMRNIGIALLKVLATTHAWLGGLIADAGWTQALLSGRSESEEFDKTLAGAKVRGWKMRIVISKSQRPVLARVNVIVFSIKPSHAHFISSLLGLCTCLRTG